MCGTGRLLHRGHAGHLFPCALSCAHGILLCNRSLDRCCGMCWPQLRQKMPLLPLGLEARMGRRVAVVEFHSVLGDQLLLISSHHDISCVKCVLVGGFKMF